jgi:hypothetical protein
MKLDTGKLKSTRKKITFRKLRAISGPDCIKDIDSTPSLTCTSGSVDDLISAYDSSIRRLIDKHAPLQVKTITLRPNAPWYTENIREAKHKRGKAERLWRRTKLTLHQQIFKEECRNVIALLIKAKKEHYSNKIVECGTESKQLFKLSKHLMGHKGEVIVPSYPSDRDLANRFGDFFIYKITTIRDNISALNKPQMKTL